MLRLGESAQPCSDCGLWHWFFNLCSGTERKDSWKLRSLPLPSSSSQRWRPRAACWSTLLAPIVNRQLSSTPAAPKATRSFQAQPDLGKNPQKFSALPHPPRGQHLWHFNNNSLLHTMEERLQVSGGQEEMRSSAWIS